MNKEQIIELIGEDKWDEFLSWMRGQTVGINDDGSTNYYRSDVERFHGGRPVVD